MSKRQLRTAVLVGVVVVFAAIGVYMFSAVAQNRPHNSFTEGALPANQVQQPPPTTAPAAAPNAAATNVKTESFDAQPAGWTAGVSDAMPDQQGSWATESGKLVAKAPEGGQQSFEDSTFLSPINTAGRATVSVQAYPQGNQVVGIVFRYTKNGYYLFRVFRDGNNAPERRQLLRYDTNSGQFTKLAVDTQGKGYVLDTWQDLRVELDGDLITCFFNNEKVFEAHDATYAGGQAGVYTLALGDMFFDNFAVATQ